MCFVKVVSSFLALSSTTYAACYFPNGGIVGTDTACNPSGTVGACCFTGQACLSNGLCVSDPHVPAKAQFHRGSCTDKTWTNSNCPSHCLDINNNGVNVYSCNTTGVDSYCCFDDCKCVEPFEVFSLKSPADVYTLTIIGESFTQTHTSSAATSASTSSTTSSVTASSLSAAIPASPTTSAAPQQASNAVNTTALGLGLGLGIPALAALLVIGFFLWRRDKRATPKDTTRSGYPELDHNPPLAKYAHHTRAEMEGLMQTPNELSAHEKPVELPVTGHTNFR